MDISDKFRPVTSGTLRVPSSITSGSNCTLRGKYRDPLTFRTTSFADAICILPGKFIAIYETVIFVAVK